jgi:hypothetical protein
MPTYPLAYRAIRPAMLMLATAALAVVPAHSADGPQVKLQPMHLGAFTEYGKVVEGSHVEAYGSDDIVTDQSMTRTCAWLMDEAMIGDRLSIQAGISGLFWYSLPQQNGLPHTRLIKFATGVPVAQSVYSFGDLESPYLKLHMGLFGYKYNPDAMNLGEYLFRSGTYPGYLWTGGWTLLNSNNYSANGIQGAFDFLDHRLKVDVNFFIERDIEPNFDISPSIVASYKTGIFEVGAGSVFAHLIPASSKDVTPETRDNAYYYDPVRHREMPLPQAEANRPGLSPGDTLINNAKAGTPLADNDPRKTKTVVKYYSSDSTSPNFSGIPNSQLKYYTFQGVKLMGRVSIDPLKVLNSDMLEPGAGKLYAEIAVLGVKNYPFYYEKITERMPIMVGFNIPTFKLLDQLTVEGEYYKSPFANNIKPEFGIVLPAWQLPDIPNADANNPPDPAQAFVDSSLAQKGWKNSVFWSIYARRTILPGLTLTGQIAHDHTRIINYMANPSYQPFIGHWKDWYWAIRLESAI